MKLKVVVHEVEEGRYWAEIPAIPGCATQGETFEELLQNLYESVPGSIFQMWDRWFTNFFTAETAEALSILS